MRKKPDFLLLLSILVISGVLISHFVVIEHSDMSTDNTALHNAHFANYEKQALFSGTMTGTTAEAGIFRSQELARIDLLKPRTH